MSTNTSPIIFISYSHRDRKWLNELDLHLKPLQRIGRLSIWDDTNIGVGKHWEDEIENALDSAKVAILLVSPYFMASDFIRQVELPKMLMKAALDGLVIKPLIISRSFFERDKDLSKIQAFNYDKPLKSLTPAKRDELLTKFAEEIDKSFNKRSDNISNNTQQDRGILIELIDVYNLERTNLVPASHPCRIHIEWRVSGPHVPTLDGKWRITGFVDSIGSGVHLQMGNVRLVDISEGTWIASTQRHYYTDIDVASSTLKPGFYQLKVNIYLISSNSSSSPILAYVEGPIVEFL
jgi:TIR domain